MKSSIIQQQTVELRERTYLVTRYNNGNVRIAVMTKKGPRVLTDRTTPALIAKIMAKAKHDLEIASYSNES